MAEMGRYGEEFPIFVLLGLGEDLNNFMVRSNSGRINYEVYSFILRAHHWRPSFK